MTHPDNPQPYDRIHVRRPITPRGFNDENKDLKSSGFCAAAEAPPRSDGELPFRLAEDVSTSPYIPTHREPDGGITVERLNEVHKALTGGGYPGGAPSSAKRAPRTRADMKTGAAIYEKLKETLIDHGDGSFIYKDGWDDKLVSVSLGCKFRAVEYRREKIFGPFPARRPVSGADPTAQRALDLVLNLYRLLGQEVPDK
jgi:hypothetical protein